MQFRIAHCSNITLFWCVTPTRAVFSLMTDLIYKRKLQMKILFNSIFSSKREWPTLQQQIRSSSLIQVSTNCFLLFKALMNHLTVTYLKSLTEYSMKASSIKCSVLVNKYTSQIITELSSRMHTDSTNLSMFNKGTRTYWY